MNIFYGGRHLHIAFPVMRIFPNDFKLLSFTYISRFVLFIMAPSIFLCLNGTRISVRNILSRKTGLSFTDVPFFPAEATQKGMFHSFFKGVFRKLLSMVNNRSLVFRPMKGNFPCFPLVRPKEDLLSPFNVCKQTHRKLPVF